MTAADRRASRMFVHGVLLACLCLQRFCVYAGASPVFVCLPAFVLLLGWLALGGRAVLRPITGLLFASFAVVALSSTLIAIDLPDPRIAGVSVPSLYLILLLYAGLAFGPSERFDRAAVFDIFIAYVRVIAALGIAQYLLQFAGLRLFSFMLLVPALKPILAEPLFNYQPWLGYGSTTLRSNGFFLLEPSIFSQVLALGVIVDVFMRRSWRFLPLYAAAYLFTYAGTGLLALGLALVLLIVLQPAQLPRLIPFGVAALVVAGVAAAVAPNQFAAIAGRAGEIGSSGSSAYARYITQFDVVDAIANETRTLIGYGPGAFERASFYRPGGGSAALKLYVDYGWFGLVAFVAFLLCAFWRREVAVVSLFCLVNFQIGGGYLVFPPIVILSALLCIWSAPRPARAPPEPAYLAGDSLVWRRRNARLTGSGSTALTR